MTEIEDAANLVQRFGWPDYLVFAAMLAISAIIGIYYACVGGKQNSTSEFLMAGRNMGTFPVAMSLIARYVDQLESVFPLVKTKVKKSEKQQFSSLTSKNRLQLL